MKGPRDRGHADHASARSPSQVARYQRIVGICRETSIGNSTRRRGQQADLKIRPTCHPRDRHVRYRSAAADPPLGVCTIRYSVQREINSPLVVLREISKLKKVVLVKKIGKMDIEIERERRSSNVKIVLHVDLGEFDRD